ncbi:hypothetical protein FORMB_17060 [Formosa sp. Hel1_33_131]|uniref:ParB/RepB/Spo0J family partition protein n=1 Tax=Formosa sp. Hel1_33_131 TaxID=1336794 RepID=UPI00084E2B47|nr:ParB/RepB/Spo0J family partition protein [Formosa sp. Hel1_33_131]AOR28745.1 hypothetical protein FORMB_17060 [Formosa sp. Hel1_33_131]
MSKVDHIEIPIDEIILLDKNPRTVTEDELQKLCDDIEKDPAFLLQRPPLINKVDGKYYCYAGTQRIKACRKLGKTSVKCFIEENVSSKVQDERMVKDNLHRGEWDFDKLLELDFELTELESFGFEDFEIGLDIGHEPEIDPNIVKEKFERYQNNNIKQIVLYYEQNIYADILERLHKVAEKEGLEDNSSVVIKLLEKYEAGK